MVEKSTDYLSVSLLKAKIPEFKKFLTANTVEGSDENAQTIYSKFGSFFKR